MKIGIIDADLIGRKKHRFPNLACMKLSSYNKSIGNETQLLVDYNRVDDFDKVYISKVFTDTKIPEGITDKLNVEYGGTGFFYDKAPPLPDNIEHIMPDYDLYRDWANEQISLGNPKDQFRYYLNTSIGFSTRGCFRKCSFCVNQKYDRVTIHSPLEEFLDKKNHYICLLDDNILAFPKFRDIWQSLESSGKKYEYKQGMDFRLLNKEKIKLITDSKGLIQRSFIFAFDNIADKERIIEKLKLYREYNNRFTRFYVLSGFDRNDKYDEDFWKQDVKDTFERIKILMEYGCLPYFMRYSKWVESPYRGTYSNLNRWCNYPRYFKKLSYREMQWSCAKWAGREISSEVRHMQQIEEVMPEVAQEYFDIKYEGICKYKIIG